MKHSFVSSHPGTPEPSATFTLTVAGNIGCSSGTSLGIGSASNSSTEILSSNSTENSSATGSSRTIISGTSSNPGAGTGELVGSVEEFEAEPIPSEVSEEQPMLPATVEVNVAEGSGVPGCDETNECFIPYEVSIAVGGEVIWNNVDSAAHTVTSGNPSDEPDGVFDSSLFMAGTTFSHTFDEAGTYEYFCMVHPWMKGIIQVS